MATIFCPPNFSVILVAAEGRAVYFVCFVDISQLHGAGVYETHEIHEKRNSPWEGEFAERIR